MNSHETEKEGLKILKEKLKEQGRKYSESDSKTFDLIVEGEYVELKAKSKGRKDFDFISLTENQVNALGEELKSIFVVLNVGNPKSAEVIEIRASDLKACEPKKYVSYEWNKGAIKHLLD